jgi:pimeloyl-ACP methyl ester carboxylesterase
MPELPTLLLFPGLGADPRVFAPQQSIPYPLKLGSWPEPESAKETLAHYAQRVAEGIGAHENLYVGGISLGAMVALEAARLLNARGVFLIGGCTSGRQISPAFRSVLSASAAMPTKFIHPSLLLSPLAFLVFERLSREHRRLMTRVLRQHSPEQTRWSCRAILDWECCAMQPRVPVYAIHGQEDEIIPPSNVKVDCVVPRGRHLINLQCADRVNRTIAEQIRIFEGRRIDAENGMSRAQ